MLRRTLLSPHLDRLARSQYSTATAAQAQIHPLPKPSTSTRAPPPPPSPPPAPVDTPPRKGKEKGPPPVGGNSLGGLKRIRHTAAIKKYAMEAPAVEGGNSPETSAQGANRKPPSLAKPPGLRRKPLHTRPPLLSSPNDPVSILSRIRSAEPPPSATPAGPKASVAAHNEALHTLLVAPRSKDPFAAFSKGWLNIRNTGEAGRVPTKDLHPALLAAQAEMAKPDSRAAWVDVRELILWLLGQDDKPVSVVNWAYVELGRGEDGPRRIVDVWEAFARGDHLLLREGPEALNRSWAGDLSRSTTARGNRKLVDLFIPYVVARSLLDSASSPPEPFRTTLPTLLAFNQPLSPLLLNSSSPSNVLSLITCALSPLPNSDVATAKALAWLRQLALGRLWIQRPGGEGVDVIRACRLAFRRGNQQEAWFLWKLLDEGVASPEVAWIRTDDWDASAGRRWVNGSRGIEEDADRLRPVLPAAPASPSAVAAAAPDADADPAAAHPSPSPPSVISASLTQSLVAAFIGGFTRAQHFDEAGEIWGWLKTRSPPLDPGVTAWNGLIHGYSQRGNLLAIESTLQLMSVAGVAPDVWTWVDRFDAFFTAKQPDAAMDVVDRMFKERAVLASFSDPQVARLVYTRILLGLFGSGRVADALAVLDQMERDGLPIDMHILNIVLRHHTEQSKPNFSGVVDVFRRVAALGLEADVFSFTMILQAVLKAGHKDATARLIKIMEATGVRPTVTTYGALINHLAKGAELDQLRAAIELLDEMERRGLQTNEIIYTSIIQGFLRAIPNAPMGLGGGEDRDDLHPYFRAALALRKRMEGRGMAINRIGRNAFLGGALALGTPRGVALALDVWAELKRPQAGETTGELKRAGRADSWYTILDGFARMGDWARARELLREMEQEGFEVRGKGLRRLVDTIRRGGWAA